MKNNKLYTTKNFKKMQNQLLDDLITFFDSRKVNQSKFKQAFSKAMRSLLACIRDLMECSRHANNASE